MSLLQHSYVTELEILILDTLLPAYEKYNQSKGLSNPLEGVNPKLLVQINRIKKIPALLRPKENTT